MNAAAELAWDAAWGTLKALGEALHALVDALLALSACSFTLTLNMAWLLSIGAVLAVVGFYVIRYHVLARYSRLPALQEASGGDATKGSTVAW